MKKILFDASVHLGQFNIENENERVWCKNSQASLSKRGLDDVQGLYTFNENGWMDRIIWDLDRTTQDVFYPFMDLFYSIQNIDGVPLALRNIEILKDIKGSLSGIDDSNILTCYVAIQNGVDEIHTTYDSLKDQSVVEFMQSKGINILAPENGIALETGYISENNVLEGLYQVALRQFRKSRINPTKKLHR